MSILKSLGRSLPRVLNWVLLLVLLSGPSMQDIAWVCNCQALISANMYCNLYCNGMDTR